MVSDPIFTFFYPIFTFLQMSIGIAKMGEFGRRVLGLLINLHSLLVNTLVFVLAVSTLWGWWFLGIVTTLVFLARVYDNRVNLRTAIFKKACLRHGERYAAIFVVCLAMVALE